jgi:hypothetical protein
MKAWVANHQRSGIGVQPSRSARGMYSVAIASASSVVDVALVDVAAFAERGGVQLALLAVDSVGAEQPGGGLGPATRVASAMRSAPSLDEQVE